MKTKSKKKTESLAIHIGGETSPFGACAQEIIKKSG